MATKLYRAIVGVGISLGAAQVVALGGCETDMQSSPADGGSPYCDAAWPVTKGEGGRRLACGVTAECQAFVGPPPYCVMNPPADGVCNEDFSKVIPAECIDGKRWVCLAGSTACKCVRTKDGTLHCQ